MAERVAAEEAEAAQKREKEEQLAEQRRQRDLERAAAAEEARKKALREEEAAERARLRSQQAKTVPATGDAWRARAPAQTSVPPRAQNSAPAPSPVSATGPPKIGIAPGGWRQREKEKQAGAPAGAATATSPATTNAPLPDTKKDTDGFEMVSGKGPHGSGRLRERTGWAEVCTCHVRVFNFRLVVCFVCFFPIRYHTFVSSGGGRPATKA